MRHGTSNRRQRGRGNGQRRGNNQRMQVYDSNGPDVRIRGTAHQVTEKYTALAKDAASSGDRILAESYLQYAEHYQRIINSWEEGVQDDKLRASETQENSLKKSQGIESDDDLSLPSSILGEKPNIKSEEYAAEASV
ncbi:MAG: DUF4167 domain-containing protein [Alphaproteobacteria bacterium]|nr:DUF4167 domain-containing protein [Alphaproteobacteria bacterium]